MATTDFGILLSAIINKSGINSELKQVQEIINKYSIDIMPELKTASLRNQMKAVSKEIANDFNKTFGTNLTGADIFKAFESQAKQAEKSLIQQKKAIEDAKKAQEEYNAKVKEGKALADKQSNDASLSKQKTLYNEIASNQKQVYSLKQKLLSSDTLETQELNKQIGVLEKRNKYLSYKIDKSGLTSSNYESELSASKQIYENQLKINQAKQVDKSINADIKTQIQSQINDEKQKQSEIKKTVKELQSQQNLTFGKTQLNNNITSYIKNNTKLGVNFREELIRIQTELKDVDAVGLKNLQKQFSNIKSSANALGQTGDTVFAKLQKNSSQFMNYLLSASVIMTGIRGIKELVSNVYDIDTAMTSLYKVTDETDAKYNSFLDNAGTKAKSLSRSISSLIEQTANWAKLGYSLDESSMLAGVSSIYSNVGEVNDDTAVSDLVTGMKAFNLQASEAIKLVDIYNKLGNEFAVTSAGIGEGVKNSASALALQGNSLEQVVALLTGGGEITQNVGELGNMLKVASLRVASMTGKLEELGETYEDIESVSMNQTKIYNYTKGQVNILDEQNNKLKDTYTILEEVAKAWGDVEALDKSSLLELLFGKQRANQGAAIITAFQSGQIQKALKAANDATGSAMQEQERWAKSLEARIQNFHTSIESLSNTLVNSDILKTLVDIGTTGVSAIDGLANSFMGLPTALAGVSAILSTKNLGISNVKYARPSSNGTNAETQKCWEKNKNYYLATA